jgi:hypothetical protein
MKHQETAMSIPGSAVPISAALPAAAERRVQSIVGLLPRISELAGLIARQIDQWPCSELEGTLKTHMASLSALRFELLVSPGLRAGPSERDLAAFRRQVETVSDCTAATWEAVRSFGNAAIAQASHLQDLVTDFTMEFRALVRRCEEEARAAEALHAHLAQRAASAAAESRDAMGQLITRHGSVRDQLQRLDQLNNVGRSAQRAAYDLAESHTALRSVLKDVPRRLAGGLLEKLRDLVASDVSSPADELRAAQHARADLQAGLSQVLSELVQLQAARQDAQVWLTALVRAANDCAEPPAVRAA